MSNLNIYKINYPKKYCGTLLCDCSEEELKFLMPERTIKTDYYPYKDVWKPIPMYHAFHLPPTHNTFFSPILPPFMYAFYDNMKNDVEMIKLLEKYGELLPLEITDYSKNALAYHCLVNVGDKENILTPETRSHAWSMDPKKIVMRKNMLPNSGLFVMYGDFVLYSIESPAAPVEDNFVALYQRRGYKGLVFEKISYV